MSRRRHEEAARLRTARRDSLAVLLSRAGRGVLTLDEGALLRAHVEAEMRDADNARSTATGAQNRAAELARTIKAADAAIVEAEERAKEAERSAELADAVTAETKRLKERRTTTLRHRAERAEAERDRYEAAWQSARQGRAEQRTLADIRQRRLTIRGKRIIELEQRADQAERRTEWAEHNVSSVARALARGDRYRTAWRSARQRAHKAKRRGNIWKAKAHEIEADRDRLADLADTRADAPAAWKARAKETEDRAREEQQRADDAERRHVEALAATAPEPDKPEPVDLPPGFGTVTPAVALREPEPEPARHRRRCTCDDCQTTPDQEQPR